MLKNLFGGAIGGVIGYGLSWWSKLQAQAAVQVRPRLAEVGFFDALLTNHGLDWVFYHEPLLGTVFVTALGFLLGNLLFVFPEAFIVFADEVIE